MKFRNKLFTIGGWHTAKNIYQVYYEDYLDFCNLLFNAVEKTRVGGSWRVTGSDLRKWLSRVRFKAMVLWLRVENIQPNNFPIYFFFRFQP